MEVYTISHLSRTPSENMDLKSGTVHIVAPSNSGSLAMFILDMAAQAHRTQFDMYEHQEDFRESHTDSCSECKHGRMYPIREHGMAVSLPAQN